MCKRYRLIIYTLLWFLLTGCGAKTPSKSVAKGAEKDSVAQADRLSHTVIHFWDSVDLRDGTVIRDTAFIEQNFANFAALLTLVTPDKAREAIDTLLFRSFDAGQAYDMFEYVSDRYLNDPNSPLRNEALYILVLRGRLGLPDLPDWRREVAEARLEEAEKNRPGSKASDLRLVTRDGTDTTLLGLLGDRQNLVIFHDPECQECQTILRALAENPVPAGMRIIAIDVTGDRSRWQNTACPFPDSWVSTYATVLPEKDERYILRALPTFYLLDREGTVLLKDPPPERIITLFTAKR